MSIKIKNIKIKNFKTFSDVEIEFDEAGFIVFDGPNGFGKTTVYDAIEFLLTGRINRYQRLSIETIDHRQTFREHPYLCEHSDSGDLEISSELIISSKSIFLLRIIKREMLESVFKILDTKSTLKVKDNIDDDYVTVDDEGVFFQKIIGQEYLRNFEFINYIEQDENLVYLKRKDVDRKDVIGHLFNTSEFNVEVNKIKAVISGLNRLKSPDAKKSITDKETTIQQLEKLLTEDNVQVSFERVIDAHEFFWDKEEIDFESYGFNDILGESSDLTKLSRLVNEKDEYIKVLDNRRTNSLLSKENQLKQFIELSPYLVEYELYESLAERNLSIDTYLLATEKSVPEFVESKLSNLNRHIISILDDSDIVVEYTTHIKSLRSRLKSSGELKKSLADLKTARDRLIGKSSEVVDFPEDESVCILCGHDWGEMTDLIKSIGTQTSVLDKYINDNASTIEMDLISFKEKYMDLISGKLIEFKERSAFDVSFWSKIKKYYSGDGQLKAEHIKKGLTECEVKYEDLLNKEFKAFENDAKIEMLKGRLKVKLHNLEGISISESNDEIYEKVLDKDLELLKKLSVKEIDEKSKYVRSKFNLYNNELLVTKKKELQQEKDKLATVKRIHAELTKVRKQYEIEIAKYQERIIKDIEIMFHIYSGRIVQDRKGGNGLFITTSKGIRFVDHPENSYDALFKLSSGQLAALIISFTLSLNKKYSMDKLLLIDDPVQTLDELNIAAFIEVLRNDFGGHQIFISTHEDMMSAYMRYKFEKYGLPVKRVSLSEVQLG